MAAKQDILSLVEDATYAFTLGDNAKAIKLLQQALAEDAQCFEAWHALTEVYYSEKDYDKALDAAEHAYKINPNDVHINTSLSRIWVEKGDKQQAEHFGGQVKILSWKEQLKDTPEQ